MAFFPSERFPRRPLQSRGPGCSFMYRTLEEASAAHTSVETALSRLINISRCRLREDWTASNSTFGGTSKALRNTLKPFIMGCSTNRTDRARVSWFACIFWKTSSSFCRFFALRRSTSAFCWVGIAYAAKPPHLWTFAVNFQFEVPPYLRCTSSCTKSPWRHLCPGVRAIGLSVNRTGVGFSQALTDSQTDASLPSRRRNFTQSFSFWKRYVNNRTA